VTDSRPATQPASHVAVAITLNAKASSLKTLQIHLEQLSTTGNYVDGAPSTLLDTVGLGRYILGDTVTVRFEQPVFKPLRNGYVAKLKITVRDNSGRIINNHRQPILVVQEFRPIKYVK